MVEITHREKTEEEIKAIEEARKTHGKWMGEERVADIKPAEPADGERVLSLIHISEPTRR